MTGSGNRLEYNAVTYVLCLIFAMAVSAFAAEDDLPESLSPEVVQEQIDNLVQPEKVAEALGLGWPVHPPEKPQNEIVVEIQDALNKIVHKQYPESRIEEIRDGAAEKFKTHEVGDVVSFTPEAGRFAGEKIEGELKTVSPHAIEVGSRWYRMHNLEEDDAAKFRPGYARKETQQYIRREIYQFEREREKYREGMEERLTTYFFKKNGYVKHRGEWRSKTALLEETLAERRKLAEKKIRAQFEKKKAEAEEAAAVAAAAAAEGTESENGAGSGTGANTPGEDDPSVGGKYANLLKKITVPQDEETYGAFKDWGRLTTTEYRGYTNLPHGYWVYVAPDWHIWGEKKASVPGSGQPGVEETNAAWQGSGGSETSFAAAAATGQPDSPADMGENQPHPTAWAPAEADAGEEWLQLTFAQRVPISTIRIYERMGGGAVSRVEAVSEGTDTVLWQSNEIPPPQPGPLTVSVANPVLSDTIRITLDTARVPGWNQIDAVELGGIEGARQWAVTASASSVYDPNQAVPPGAATGAGADQVVQPMEGMPAEMPEIDIAQLEQGMALVGGSILAGVIIFALAVHFFVAFCFKKICEKAGSKPGVLVWIPVLQLIPLLSTADIPLWAVIGFFVPVVNLILTIWMWSNICQARGKSPLLVILLFIPVLNIVFIPYLAFSE